MKFKSIIFSALAAIALTGCQKEGLDGKNPLPGDGQPLMMTLNFRDPSLKTKANNGSAADLTAEAAYTDLSVIVLRANNELDVPVFYTVYDDSGNGTYNVPITANADKVYVLTNSGNPATPGTAGFAVASAIASKGAGVTALQAMQGVTWNLISAGAPTQATTGSGTNLFHVGSAAIAKNLVDNTASAYINLGFLTARVSFTSISFFNAYTDTDGTFGDDNTQQTPEEVDAQAASGFDIGATKTRVVSLFILNAPATTYLFPHAETTAENGKTWDKAYFTKTTSFYQGLNNSTNFQWTVPGDNSSGAATYYPTVSGYSGTYAASLLENITADAWENRYFYLWENRDNGLTDSGITTAVIGVAVYYTTDYRNAKLAQNPSVVLPADGTVNYYPIPLNHAINNSGTVDISGISTVPNGGRVSPNPIGTKFPNYSIKAGVQYMICANITGEGTLNPFQPLRKLTLGVTVKPTSWDVFDPVGL